MSEESKVYQGEVIFFSAKKGYGFVKWEGEHDLFVYWSNIEMDGFKVLRPGQIVEFQLGENAKGLQGINIRVISEGPGDLMEE